MFIQRLEAAKEPFRKAEQDLLERKENEEKVRSYQVRSGVKSGEDLAKFKKE